MKQISHFLYIFIFCVCVIVVFFVFPVLPIHGQGFMVKPMRLDVHSRRGDTIVKEVEIANMLADRVQTAYIEMMYLGETQNGRWAAIPRDSKISEKLKAWSCLDWVTVDKKRLDIQPLGKDKAHIKIKVPLRAHGFYGMAIIVRSEPIRTEEANVAVELRFLVPVLVEIQGRPPQQKIDLVDINMQFLEQSEKNPATTLVSMEIVNKGGTYSRLKGNINVMRQAGEHWQRISQAEFREVGIIPGVELNLKSDLKRRLPPGNYKLRGALYVDGRQIRPLVKEIDFVGDPTVTEVAADIPLILDSSILSIKAVPGSVRTSVIKVWNPSEEAVNVSVVAEVPESLRGVSLGELKGDDLTCAEWVEVAPKNFTLRPGGRQNIRVIARLPKNLEMHANYYAALGLRAVYADGQSAGETRSLVCVQNAKMEARPVAQAMKVSLAAEEGSKYIVRARFANVGNIHFTPRCKATVTKADGAPVLETALSGQTDVMLPLGTGHFSGILDFSRVEAGVYRLTALIDCGGETKPVSKILPIRVSVEEGQKVVTAISVNAK